MSLFVTGLFFQRHVVRCPVLCLSPCLLVALSSCACWMCVVCVSLFVVVCVLCVVCCVLCCVLCCCVLFCVCCVCCVYVCRTHSQDHGMYMSASLFLLIDLPQWFHRFCFSLLFQALFETSSYTRFEAIGPLILLESGLRLMFSVSLNTLIET